jgi:BON domain
MVNPNYSGSRQRSANDDRSSWNPNDDQSRSDRDRDRDRDDERWVSDRGRHGYPDQDAGSFSRDRENRNQSYPASGYDRPSGSGLDDRFTGRGGGDWTERSYGTPDRSGGFGAERGRETGYHGSRGGAGGIASGSSDTRRFDQDRSSYGRDYGDRGGYREYSSYRDYERGMGGDRGMEDRGMNASRDVGGHRGKGPQNWQRSDERIRESVNEALADHDHIDATHIQVTVKDGEVTLSGFVEDRRMKRLAEDCVEQVSGVKEVQNQIRIHSDDNRLASRTGSERTSSERTGSERTGSERTGSERTGSERTGNEKDKDKKAQA